MNVQTALLDVRRMGQVDRLTIAACTPAIELMENANKAVARELNSHRIRTFQLDGSVDLFISSCFVHVRKPDADIFRVALDIAQAPAHQVVYLEDQPMFVEVAESLGIRGIRHTAGLSSPTSAMARAWRQCVTANLWTPA